MPFYDSDVIEKARQMDLLTYLQNYDPQELVHVSGNVYCTKTHDSLRISNGKWCWFSQGIGGRSALDYLIKVKDYSFLEAVETVTGKAAVQPPSYPSVQKEKPKFLLLPEVSRCATHAVSYLESRGISSNVIDYCIKTGRLYESFPHHNVVFVGYDKQGKARFGCQRGIGNTRFMGDLNGSDKHYSFALPAQVENSTVHLCESAIDVMSYATLICMAGRSWQKENLLSLAGIYQPRKKIEDSKIPAALTRVLEDYPHIKKIILHLDNDGPGRQAAKAIMTVMPKEYEVWNRPPPQGKDVNDYLCLRLGLPIRTAAKEKTNER